MIAALIAANNIGLKDQKQWTMKDRRQFCHAPDKIRCALLTGEE